MSPAVWNQCDWRVPQLRRAARARKLVRYSRRRRQELQAMLRDHDAAVRIQRFMRRRGPAVSNTDCPITLERLPYSDVGRLFCFTTSNDIRIAYTPDALASYVASTGNRTDPVTRERYSDADLERLKAMVPKLRARIDRVLEPARTSDLMTDTILRRMGEDLIHAASQEPEEFLAFLLLQWASAYTMVSMTGFGDIDTVRSTHRDVLRAFRASQEYTTMEQPTRETADRLLSIIDTTVMRGSHAQQLMIVSELLRP